MARFNSTPENYTLVFLSMLWGRKLLSYSTAIFLRIPGLNAVATWVVPFLMVVAFLLAFKSFSKSISGNCLFFYLICTAVFVLTYIFFPQNADYLNDEISYFLFSALPFVFVGFAIDINKLSRPFYIISLLCIILEAVNVLILEVNERAMGDYQYDMGAAYSLLPHLLMVLWHLMKKINIIDMIVALVGLFLLMGYGTRGTIMCVGVFIVIYLFFGHEGKRSFWSYLLIIVAVVSAIYFLNSIMEVVDISIAQTGLSSRITNMYQENSMDFDSGRGSIRDIILRAISESGVFGLGICGDRVASRGIYSHNLCVELWASFGYVVGSVLFFVLVMHIYKAWKSCESLEEKGFLLLLVAEVAHLFVSDTFLHSAHLFMLIGLCMSLIKKRRLTPKKMNTINSINV